MWTGEHVILESVTLEDAEKVNSLYGRKMLLWWNYPVTDYKVDKLALGPIYNLGNDLATKIGGFIINPMEFAEASKISIHTGADYAWNTEAYDAIMKGNVQISVDGVEWKTVLENNDFREVFVGDLNESARYIKYVATEDQENQVYVREFMVNKNTVRGIRTNVEGSFEYNKSVVGRNE